MTGHETLTLFILVAASCSINPSNFGRSVGGTACVQGNRIILSTQIIISTWTSASIHSTPPSLPPSAHPSLPLPPPPSLWDCIKALSLCSGSTENSTPQVSQSRQATVTLPDWNLNFWMKFSASSFIGCDCIFQVKFSLLPLHLILPLCSTGESVQQPWRL